MNTIDAIERACQAAYLRKRGWTMWHNHVYGEVYYKHPKLAVTLTGVTAAYAAQKVLEHAEETQRRPQYMWGPAIAKELGFD